MRESWRMNANWPSAIELDGCQFGLETDARCDLYLCKFRCDKSEEPDVPSKTGSFFCPKNLEYEPKKETKGKKNEKPLC